MMTIHKTRRACAAGAAMVLGTALVVLAGPAAQAQAAAFVPTCNGFTEVEAAGLGYVTYVGGPGVDVVIANGPNWNWIMTFGGNDIVRTGSGNDMICLGGDDDFADSAGGFDSVYGDAGEDIIELGPGDFDYAEGGTEQDVIDGELGPDTIYGDNQLASANDARDDIFGGGDNDTLIGGGGNDDIHGEGGDDALFGEVGVDTLYGGADTDTADGGLDADVDTCVAETMANCP